MGEVLNYFRRYSHIVFRCIYQSIVRNTSILDSAQNNWKHSMFVYHYYVI